MGMGLPDGTPVRSMLHSESRGDAKVTDLSMHVVREEYIRSLDVTVHDGMLV